jgi:hypothetical protein
MLKAAAGQMFSERENETRGRAGPRGPAGDQMDARKRTVRREKQDQVLAPFMENEVKAVVFARDHPVHPGAGKDGGKFIDDLCEKIEVQSDFLPER